MFSFIETRLFSRLVQDYFTDAEYGKLQGELIRNPEAGRVIRGSGGVRKIRWAAAGSGKRGGYRVIYFVRRSDSIIWMLTMYPKNARTTIPARILRKIREEIGDD